MAEGAIFFLPAPLHEGIAKSGLTEMIREINPMMRSWQKVITPIVSELNGNE